MIVVALSWWKFLTSLKINLDEMMILELVSM
jgi:hypothetical protein